MASSRLFQVVTGNHIKITIPKFTLLLQYGTLDVSGAVNIFHVAD